MKLRSKFLVALAGLVALMAVVFFALSEGYTQRLFSQFATKAEQHNAGELETIFKSFYEQNQYSWSGVNLFVQQYLQLPPDEFLALVNPKTQKVIFQYPQAGDGNSDGRTYQAMKVPVVVSGSTVGVLYFQDRSTRSMYRMQQSVQHSMTLATVIGTLATALVALLLGAWLASRMTKPLQTMTKAMKKIEDGDLETRLSIGEKDEFGQVASAFNAMIDKLYQTEQSRRHLVADVAHELRTPLTIMQGKLELIQQGVEPAEPEQLLPIQDEIVRLTMLVQDLHQLSLAEVGQLPLKKQLTDMNELVGRLVENFGIEAEDHDIQLHFHSDSDVKIIANVDPNRVTQVFVNLVGNALRYTPAGGTITVHTERVESQVQVSVRDTGRGIEEQHLEHIFDRFYRAQEDRSRESGGTGLGLAIAKEFVEAHGGTIEVSSAVDEGTTFLVKLPL